MLQTMLQKPIGIREKNSMFRSPHFTNLHGGRLALRWSCQPSTPLAGGNGAMPSVSVWWAIGGKA